MNLTKMFKIQKEIDERIDKEKDLKGVDLLDKKILSLQVELGELANELPEVFKFWSNKKNNYKKALEEYCDCLHFILSIGLELGATSEFLGKLHLWNADEVSQFNALFCYFSELHEFKWAHDYNKKEMQSKYKNALEGLLGLGVYGLGFTWDEIEQVYFDKNNINHERQENGY